MTEAEQDFELLLYSGTGTVAGQLKTGRQIGVLKTEPKPSVSGAAKNPVQIPDSPTKLLADFQIRSRESTPTPSPVKSGKHQIKGPMPPPAKKLKFEELQEEYMRKNITLLDLKIEERLNRRARLREEVGE